MWTDQYLQLTSAGHPREKMYIHSRATHTVFTTYRGDDTLDPRSPKGGTLPVSECLQLLVLGKIGLHLVGATSLRVPRIDSIELSQTEPVEQHLSL
jgi:hypothetical protein